MHGVGAKSALWSTAAPAKYYYTGSYDSKAAIYNKVKPFIDKLAGFLMQPTDVRFAMIYDDNESDSVMERAQLVSDKAHRRLPQFRQRRRFGEAVVWALINGAQIAEAQSDRK